MNVLKIFFISILVLKISYSIKLQASKRDSKFWNTERILLDEPKGEWPDDAVNCRYVGDWSYWYRRKGMQTSTDDVIVSFVALYPEMDKLFFCPDGFSIESPIMTDGKAVESDVSCYVDLGCGVGSTLLLVANNLRPKKISVGIEAQEQSVRLLQRTLSELPDDAPNIRVAHKDLRTFVCKSDSSVVSVEEEFFGSNSVPPQESDEINRILIGRCNLVTANPPYAPLQSGTLCKDAQRRSARFELRGGVEEYLVTAKALLLPTGRFVLAFWSRDDERVKQAVEAVKNLEIYRRYDVLMGNKGRADPHLSVYDIRFESLHTNAGVPSQCEVIKLDITRDPSTGGLNKNYEKIRKYLGCSARPLKQKSIKTGTE